MTLKSNTLRPGLLVSLNTSIKGNVNYTKIDLEPNHQLKTGEARAKWETTRLIEDPKEHEDAIKVRGKARSLVIAACAKSVHGLLCPKANADKLEKAVEEARKLTEAFNATAKLTHISVNIITGEVAADDVEAVKAINREVRDLLEQMETGLATMNVKAVRDAANKAKSVGTMLTPGSSDAIKEAIDTARKAARKIVKAGEAVSQEVDLQAIQTLKAARTSFLDFGEGGEVGTPEVTGRGLDLGSDAPEVKTVGRFRAMELGE